VLVLLVIPALYVLLDDWGWTRRDGPCATIATTASGSRR